MLPEPFTILLRPRRGLMLAAACLLLCGVFTTTAHAANNDYCATGSTTTYDGPANGTWGTAGSTTTTNWSGGLPDDNCQAVIPSGDTVTLTTTPGPGYEGTFAGASAQGLTIDGGATLIVEGVSSQGEQGNVANNTGLTFGSYGLTIQSGGTLDIEATNNVSPFTGDASGETPGGSASVTTDGDSTSAITNAGTINASSSSSSYNDLLQWNTQLTNTGTINIQSGTLTDLGANYPQILTNTGTINVSPGATWASSAGDGSSVTNSTGTVNNSGTATMTGSMFWIQDGGTETGNPIQLQGGETLQDSSGAAAFEFDGLCATGGLTGTIPANQTISVVGVTTNCSGNEAQTGTLSLGGSSNATVANHGTLVLDAPGSGTTSGGAAILEGGELDNYGTLESTVSDTSYRNQLLDTLVNEAGGVVNVSGGELQQSAGTATTNDGSVTVGAGTTWIVQGGAFTNNGTLAMGIASPTDVAQFSLTAAGNFYAGGTLAPTLASGYTPSVGTEFPLFLYNGGTFYQTFAATTGGFNADYTQESASPGYVGVIYQSTRSSSTGLGSGSGSGSNSTGSGSTSTSSGSGSTSTGSGSSGTRVLRPTVVKVSGGAAEMLVTFACAKDAKSCDSYTYTGTVDKKTVASGKGTVKRGKTVTVTLKLNASGLKLLKREAKLKVKVVIKAAGKTLKTATVTVTRPKPVKKKTK